MDTAIAYLVVLSLPLWLVVEELLHRRETGMAVDINLDLGLAAPAEAVALLLHAGARTSRPPRAPRGSRSAQVDTLGRYP